MRVAILSSGGKDSAAAWWWATCRGWEVTHLVTMIVEGKDSMMFQIPGTEIVGHQAKLSDTTWLPIKTQGIEDLEVLVAPRQKGVRIGGKISPLNRVLVPPC